MRLNRLEIAGFKSFPDRSELTFDHGVTAIVGPNGCGKSNVVDALTWVLGEQSAKSLRGDRMEDVIFGGSDARKPTAAAEVRLRLSGVAARVPASPGGNGGNGNGHAHGQAVIDGGGSLLSGGGAAIAIEDDVPLIVRDVELMRRLYRSGESEYLIDGATCRLRDVQDLLMDSGLGVKAYAVIEQGKIGQILSARPTDRRQLIEEAAGVTKYKSRRRAAELKLEAAQQNLTRVDDIVYEVEKQRGALKRQAAKARRYKRLREELRRWEKVQFARRYALLSEAIEAARARLADARTRETSAAATLAELETTLERLRLELTEADAATTSAREAAHASELENGRLQQQAAFDRRQIEQLAAAGADIEAEVRALESRREPARLELESRREAASSAATARQEAAEALAAEDLEYAEVQSHIEGLEGDVEAARSEVFAAVNAATALRHAMEHASSAKVRIREQLAKLEVEGADLRVEAARAEQERAAAESAMARARQALESLGVDRASRESELAGARASREARAAELRSVENGLAGVAARLQSLEELDLARAEYGEGARLILAEVAASEIGQLGSVADYLEVDGRYERAVEACVGDLLQYVVVRTHDQAEAGIRLAEAHHAGRVGFVVADAAGITYGRVVPQGDHAPIAGVRSLLDVVKVSGPAADAIGDILADAWIADDFGAALEAACRVSGPIATPEGEVFHGLMRVEGGARAEARGILTTKREIKELRERAEEQRHAAERLHEEVSSLDLLISSTEATILVLQGEQHGQEKSAIGFELQAGNALAATERIARKQEQIGNERRTAEEELRAQDARYEEAQASIARIEVDQRAADAQLNDAQRRLFEARERMQAQAAKTAEAKAVHAGLVERASALGAEVGRLEEAGRDLESRVTRRAEDLLRNTARSDELRAAVAEAERALDAGLRLFDELRERVKTADERSASLRDQFNTQESRIRDARRVVEQVRAEAAHFDVARATAESDLTHLAAACVESVQATLDEVHAEVDELDRSGMLASPRPVDDSPEAAEVEDETEGDAARSAVESADATPAAAAPPTAMTADEMVADLRAKIERMGAVNMMAIDQFDDLESRHVFLTTQRKDLIDSIAATNDAIRKIDKTTRERFREAFAAINGNFAETFRTLFGGGQAGLVLLDETDQLESGIDMIAQPPGKRLQNVQLLSGGEKALTAMALMFAIFKYRPSPFCLLDEIDAPLDDANIGRFVEMLQGMQDATQFILITHNRKTMEIADRLYGVTMEEPGVSKLISVQLN
jgi:chromosome segregation protein